MKRLMRNANLRFGFGKATSGPATKGEKESMAATEFSSTSMYFPESAVAASGRSGGVSTLTGRRGRGARATALASTLVAMIVAVVAMMAAVVSDAQAAFGDDFGMAPINDGPGRLQDAPAFPGIRAFWAGVCDFFSAPVLGLPILGGVGGCPDQILSTGGQR